MKDKPAVIVAALYISIMAGALSLGVVSHLTKASSKNNAVSYKSPNEGNSGQLGASTSNTSRGINANDSTTDLSSNKPGVVESASIARETSATVKPPQPNSPKGTTQSISPAATPSRSKSSQYYCS